MGGVVRGSQVVEVGGSRPVALAGGSERRRVVVRGVRQRVEERWSRRRTGGRNRGGVYVQPGVLLLPLRPPVLEPDLDLCFRQRQRQR